MGLSDDSIRRNRGIYIINYILYHILQNFSRRNCEFSVTNRNFFLIFCNSGIIGRFYCALASNAAIVASSSACALAIFFSHVDTVRSRPFWRLPAILENMSPQPYI